MGGERTSSSRVREHIAIELGSRHRRYRDPEEPRAPRYCNPPLHTAPWPTPSKLTKVAAGIGQFTIVDNAVVNEADLGVNFFLDESCVGKSRARCCTELLVELNPEVQGDWFPKVEVRII